MNNRISNEKVKKLAAIAASTLWGTALLAAALAPQVSAATFWDYTDAKNSLTITIETNETNDFSSVYATDWLSVTVSVPGVEGRGEAGGVELEYGRWDSYWSGVGRGDSSGLMYGRGRRINIDSRELRGYRRYVPAGSLVVWSEMYMGWGWGVGGPIRRFVVEKTEFKERETTQVPEPTAIAALSLLGLGAVATRRQRRTHDRNTTVAPGHGGSYIP